MALTAGCTRSCGRFLALVALVLALSVASVDVVWGQPRGERRAFRFTVQIEGITAGPFVEVSGLGTETEVVEFREGGSNDVRKLPGRTKWPPIVLKRGFTGDRTLYDWATANATTGTVVRRSVLVTVHDAEGQPVARYHLEHAWPSKWMGPTLKASGNEVAIETLELVHEGLTLVDDDQ
jgi:phage tail-like protein